MRWHHTPSRECMGVAIAEQKAILNYRSYLPLPKQTRSMSCIKFGVGPLRALSGVVNFRRRHPEAVMQSEDDVLD